MVPARRSDDARCRRIRSKGMYVEAEPEETEPGDGFCWCTHTMNCLGPDGEVADAESCRPGRSCFEPA